MNKRPIISLGVVVLLIGFFAVMSQKTSSESGKYFPIPSIGTNEEYETYRATFKTYQSEFGFSFDYPSHLEVSAFSEGNHWIVLTPSDDDSEHPSRIIVSVGLNDEQMTAEEWFLSDGGYSHKNYGDYHKTHIDEQEAVYTDGGMWFVINTPDNKYRISIADMRGEDGSRLFTEMGNIIESLTFN